MSVVASVLSSSHTVRVISVLSRVSAASKSVAKFLQPQLVRKFAELDLLSGHLLQNPHTPLYTIQVRNISGNANDFGPTLIGFTYLRFFNQDLCSMAY